MLNVEIHTLYTSPICQQAVPGQLFLHLLFESSLAKFGPVCGGAGLCGKCRLRFVSSPPLPSSDDFSVFSSEEIADGWRLACRHFVVESCCIEVTWKPCFQVEKIDCSNGLVIDIGTTNIKYACVALGNRSEEHSVINPQAGVGSEVMSRLRYALSAPSSRKRLRDVVVQVLDELTAKSHASSMTVVGNPTMISLLLDVPLDKLAYAPYSLPWTGGAYVQLSATLPEMYVPVLLGPFVGADVSAGIALLWSGGARYPYLLADFGTNGEFVLALDEDRYLACSVPMGPALEGVGLACGAVAAENVLNSVTLTPGGVHWNCAGRLVGISGTGYISLLSVLKRVGLVDPCGHFKRSLLPLGQKMAERLDVRPVGRVFRLEADVYLAEKDVEEFLKSKAAVNVAVRTLLEQGGIDANTVDRIYLAGALGGHVLEDDLFELGFFPETCRGKIECIGNSALRGAHQIHVNDSIRQWSESLPQMVSILDLVDDQEFAARFFQAMQFSWVQ